MKRETRELLLYVGIVAVFVATLLVCSPRDEIDNYVDHHEYETLLVGAPRSPQWRTVRNKYIKAHPECEACGSREDLNVHHIRPFSTHPELELVESNLVTLCRSHHLSLGHMCPDGRRNWSECSNPNVRRDAARMRNEGKW